MKTLKVFFVSSMVSFSAMSMGFQQTTVQSQVAETLKHDTVAATVNQLNASAYEVDPTILLAQDVAINNADAFAVKPRVLWAQVYAKHNTEMFVPNNKVLLAQEIAKNNSAAFEVNSKILMIQENATRNALAFEVNPQVLLGQEMLLHNASAYEVSPQVVMAQVEADHAASVVSKPSTIMVKLFDTKGDLIEEKEMLKSDLFIEKGTEFLKGSFFSGLVNGTAHYFIERGIAL